MRKLFFILAVPLFLVWSYYARPLFDTAYEVLTRGRDAVAAKIETPSASQLYDDVVAQNTQDVSEIEAYIVSRRAAGAQAPELTKIDFSSVTAYETSTVPLRDALQKNLGLPLPDALIGTDFSGVKETPIGEDELATYTLLSIPALPGVNMIGTLIEPKKHDPRMMVIIASHGRGGQPDRPANGKIPMVLDSDRDLAYGAIKRGWAVFEPVYLFYGTGYPFLVRDHLAQRAQEAGITMPGIEITKLMRAIDYLATRPEIDPQRVAMVGVSYGGFYTLYTTALDPRVKAAVVTAYFNDRGAVLDGTELGGFIDWRYPNSLSLFTDPHLVALICPRPLLIESGAEDQLFPIAGSLRTIPLARAYYTQLHLDDNFVFDEFTGRHELDGESAWDFLAKALPAQK